MKRFAHCRRVLGAVLFLLLSVGVASASVLEDGSGTAGTYENLTPESGSSRIGWYSPPQERYLSQTSNATPAQVVYPIQDTTQVEVFLYSRYASFASVLEEVYVRGHWGSGTHRLQYSTRSGQVCLGDLELYYDPQAPGQYGFRPAPRPDRLVDYGLNLYWSVNGESYTRAATWLTDYQAEEGAHYYETYQGEIDPRAKYLKLVLYDHHTLPMAGREEAYRYTTTGDLALARVEIDGSLRTPASGGSLNQGSHETQNEPGTAGVPPFRENLDRTPQHQEKITETAPGGTTAAPAFREEAAPEVQGGVSSETSSASKTSSGKSGSKKSGSSGGEALQGMGQLHEDGVAATMSPEVIRPQSLVGEEQGFLDRLNTPEGIAVLFFALASLLLAAKIITRA